MMNILYEYEYLNNDGLKKHIIDNKELHQYFTHDWGKVKAQQYCGILNFDKQDYYILPKIANHNDEQNLNIFIYMLMYAYDVKLSNEQIAPKLVQNDNVRQLMKELNQYISKSFLGEDYQLGHSYFMGENIDVEFIKEYKIKPLLEEYFYSENITPDEVIEKAKSDYKEEISKNSTVAKNTTTQNNQ